MSVFSAVKAAVADAAESVVEASYNATAQALFDLVEGTDGATYVAGAKDAINDLFVGLDADNVLSVVTDLAIFGGTEELSTRKLINSGDPLWTTEIPSGERWRFYWPSGGSMGLTGLGTLNIDSTHTRRVNELKGGWSSSPNGALSLHGYHGPQNFSGLYGYTSGAARAITEIVFNNTEGATNYMLAYAHNNTGKFVTNGGTQRALGSKMLTASGGGTALRFVLNGTEINTSVESASTAVAANFTFPTTNANTSAQMINWWTQAAWVADGATEAEAALIEANVRTCLEALGAQNPTAAGPVFLFYGDSLTAGYGTGVTTSLARELREKSSYSVAPCINLGDPGYRASAADDASNNYTAFGKHFRPDGGFWSTSKGVAFVLLGTNDLGVGADSAANTIGYLRTIWAYLQADNWKVVAMTIPPAGSFDASQETERNTLNTSILGDSANWDAVFDLDDYLVNTLGATVDDGVYYTSDQIHLTNATYQALATAIAADAAIAALF